MINILIVDDEKTAADKIAEVILQHYSGIQIFKAHTSEKCRQIFSRTDLVIDILFSDILLDDANGISIAEEALATNPYVKTVFVSNNTEYSLKAIETGRNVSFFKKPVDEFYIRFSMDSYIRDKTVSDDVFSFETGHNKTLIPLGKIRYFESNKNDVTIHLNDKTVKIRAKLSSIEPQLSKYFVRCHQSFIVNIAYVSDITQNGYLLSNGEKIPISRAHLSDSRSIFSLYRGNLL